MVLSSESHTIIRWLNNPLDNVVLAKNEVVGSESREMCFGMYDSHVDIDVLFF